MADVFISYAREDERFVHLLYDMLQANNRDIWVDWKAIPPTAEWLQEIYAGIEGANAFICVLSPDFVSSSVCARELEHAINCKKRLVPVVHREVASDTVNSSLRALNWLFFRDIDDFDTTFEKLLEALDTDLNYVHASTRLLVRAREWDNKQRNSSFALRGKDLNEAEKWLAEGANKKQGPTTLHVQYITASRRQATNRQRVAFGVISFALVLTIGLALTSFFQYQAARTELQVAQSRALAAQAGVALLKNQVDQALLLGVTATKVNENYETRASLFSALDNNPSLSALLRANSFNGISYKDVSGLAFSPDGQTLISADNTQARGSTPDQGGSLQGTVLDQVLFHVASNPPNTDEPYSGITLWDVKTKLPHNLLLAYLKHPLLPVRVVFSADGKTFVSVGEDGAWRWDAKTGVPLVQLKAWDTLTYHLDRSTYALSPSGNFMAVGGCYHTDFSHGSAGSPACVQVRIVLWDLKNQRLLSAPATNLLGKVQQITISKDENLLAAGGCDTSSCTGGQVVVWNMATGNLSKPSFFPIKSPVTSVQFSPDGKYLAAGSKDGSITLWNRTSGALMSMPAQNLAAAVNCLAFNANSSVLAAGEDKEIWLWQTPAGDVSQLNPARKPLSGHQSPVTSLAWSPEGQLASGDASEGIILWNPDVSFPVSQSLQDASPIKSVAFSRDGQLFASGDTDSTVVLRNGTSMVPTDRVSGSGNSSQPGGLHSVNDLTFSPDGRMLAAVIGDNIVIVWDVASQKMYMKFKSIADYPICSACIAFSPDSHMFAVGDNSGNLVLWNTATQKIVMSRQMANNEGDIIHIAFSPDGQTLVVVDSYVHSLHLATAEDRCFDCNREVVQINDVAFLPQDAHTLALLEATGTIVYLDTVTMNETSSFLVNDGDITYSKFAFSPDGAMFAVEGPSGVLEGDTTLSLWNTAHNDRFVPAINATSGFAMFSPDNRLALFDNSGGIDLMGLTLQSWQEQACRIAARNFTASEWSQFFGDGQIYQAYNNICPDLPVERSEILNTVGHAQSAAQSNDRNAASVAYTQVADWALKTRDAMLNEYICWSGSIHQFAKEVLPACQRAVALEPGNGLYRDVRGIALASVGGYRDASEDFQFFVQWLPGDKYAQEQMIWIKMLQAGHDPFDGKKLQSLQNEWNTAGRA